jgi:hypothetical protein
VSAANWWALAAFLFLSWVIFPVASFMCFGWALRSRTLYQAMRADYEAGRPAVPAPELVDALDREHHHAAARPRSRIPRPRIPHPRRDPFPELAPDGPVLVVMADSCVHCLQQICGRCQGCGCAMSPCECPNHPPVSPKTETVG